MPDATRELPKGWEYLGDISAIHLGTGVRVVRHRGVYALSRSVNEAAPRGLAATDLPTACREADAYLAGLRSRLAATLTPETTHE